MTHSCHPSLSPSILCLSWGLLNIHWENPTSANYKFSTYHESPLHCLTELGKSLISFLHKAALHTCSPSFEMSAHYLIPTSPPLSPPLLELSAQSGVLRYDWHILHYPEIIPLFGLSVHIRSKVISKQNPVNLRTSLDSFSFSITSTKKLFFKDKITVQAHLHLQKPSAAAYYQH